MVIGEHTAEKIKITIGTADPNETDVKEMEVRGRDVLGGMPRSITLNSKEVQKAIEDTVNQIIDLLRMS